MAKPRYRLYLAVSIDGYIADEQGGVKFLEAYDASALGYDGFIKGISLMIQGSATYEKCLEFDEWPYHGIPNIVLTKRQLPVPAGAKVRFFGGEPEDLLEELSHHDGDVWIVGGGRMIASLINAGMRPSLELAIIPQLLGRGVRLFNEHQWRACLRLAQAKSHANGVVTLRYEPTAEDELRAVG